MKYSIFIINDLNFFYNNFFFLIENIHKNRINEIITIDNNKEIDNKNIILTIKKLPLERGSENILNYIHSFFFIIRDIINKKNSIFTMITIVPILLGGIPLRILNKKSVYILTGLGTIFSSNIKRFELIKVIVKFIFRFIFNGKNSKVVVQNSDDYSLLINELKVKESNINIICGCGVDENIYRLNEKEIDKKKTIILLPVRIIKEKGIYEAVEASVILKNRNINHELWISNTLDKGNPLSLNQKDVENIKLMNENVKFIGFQKNMAKIYDKIDIVCLPSYREGFPTALIEASAIGRAIITTDVPGCREIVKNNETGLLAKVKDNEDLADKIEEVIKNDKLRNTLITNAYNQYNEKYRRSIIIEEYNKIYSKHINND